MFWERFLSLLSVFIGDVALCRPVISMDLLI